MTQPKILIVDDEPFNVDYLEQELDDLNYQTVSAANGRDALDKVESESPDLILLDIMMPVMDGFEVLGCLKAQAVTREIPIIVISANSDLQSMVKGIQMGAEDYLPKPFEPTLLRARITSSLEKKRLRDLEHLYLKSLEREMEIGREIQKGFLPSEMPRVDGWEIGAYFQAAREVAGDFYDAFQLPNGHLVFVVGDVCGKGVGAALFMTLFRSLIRAASAEDHFWKKEDAQPLTPAERIQHAIAFTNNYISEMHGDTSMFATVFIGVIDVKNGSLSYINCGNESALLLRNGCVVTALSRSGPVVGLFSDTTFTVKEMTMESGDLLLAFTDGIPDCMNPAGEFFGHERLNAILDGRAASVSDVLGAIQTQLSDFISTADQFDDITLLAVKRLA